LFLLNFRFQIGDALIYMGEKLKGQSDGQLDSSPLAPAQTSIPSSRDTPPVPSAEPETPTKETAPLPSTAGPAPHAEPVPTGPAKPDSSDLQSSRRPLEDVPSKSGRSKLPRQLWSAVEAGDSSAEVELAQLYLTGDGVPKNCEQARVLLRAASKKGSTDALRQLRKLSNSGCR
jgi:hypothetical protein